MQDLDMIYFDNIVVTGTSNVLKDTAAGMNPNVAGKLFWTTEIETDMTGTLVVTLQDSADGSSWAAVEGMTHTFAAGVAANAELYSRAVPVTTRQYTKVVTSGGSVGFISSYLSQQKLDLVNG
jgi:hypothetical protein